MGSVVMPKNSADIEVLIPILEFYYKNPTWVENANYIEYIKKYLLEKGIDTKEREPQHYTKRMQILSYFGFIEWEDLENSQTARKITKSGINFYEAIRDDNQNKIVEAIIDALENTTFGRLNFGAPSSESDIEAPCLCIRMILDLKFITKIEFAYMLYKLQDQGFTYSTVLQEIKDGRDGIIQYTLPDEANKYTDWKPINFLERFHVLRTEDSETFIEPEVLKQYANRLKNLKVYSIDKNIDSSATSSSFSIPSNLVGVADFSPSKYITSQKQIIFYGVPGCGKSYSIDKRLTELGIATESRESHTKRVVFHPEFTNADFVGQILPTLTDKGVDYKFSAGQFTKILRDAYTHPSESYALIIEEINRGNAASIFGDLFQLLDRLDEDENDGEYTQGWSSYCVMNDYINAYMRGVYDNKEEENPQIALLIKNANIGIRLPPNLSIFATMNTSDQNVFKLDNAFKRRWELEMIPNEFDFTCDDEEEQKKNFNQCNAPIEGFDDFSWGGFRSAVNAFITDPINGDDTNSFSDKQLGTWFVKAKASDESETGYIISKKIFLNKVIEYLWDDVFTSDFTIFNSDIKTLSRAIEIGNSSIFSSVFVETVKQKSAELGDLQAVDSEMTKAERVIKPRYEMTPYLEHIQSFIQEKHPNFELNLNNKQFIGVKEKGKDNNLDGNNFVYFKIVKTKGIFKFCFNVKKSDTILNSLNENFDGRFESERATKTTIRYKIDLKLDDVAEFQKYKEILTSYMEESYNHYYGSAN
ncbi:MAG: AAA family ATPase [Treponema sp.]|nr:AAA family ATPase [Treponema sp.]